MAILHGSWLTQGQFFLWGEAWRRVSESEFSQLTNPTQYPYGMSLTALKTFLGSLNIRISSSLQEETLNLALPTLVTDTSILPQHSAASAEENQILTLFPWQIEGWILPTTTALDLLQRLPLNTFQMGEAWLGADLRFWSHISRWSLDLIARCKFLPTLQKTQNHQIIATWQPLLDSTLDQSRLLKFSQTMPLSCRVYQELGNELKVDYPIPTQTLILSFLGATLETQLKRTASDNPAPNLPTLGREWVTALTSESASLNLPKSTLETLESSLKTWIAPIQHQLQGQQQFLTSFKLHSPAKNQKDWLLEYGLQAADNLEFWVDAATIWNHPVERLIYQGRTIEQPQESFLKGLGLASRLYAPIETSLQQASPLFCRLDPLQAYEFIKSTVWRFKDSGLGVILPPSLAQQEGFASRLGLSIRADAPKPKKTERLGLQSLLNFNWELTIGGQRISKTEFDRLVGLDSPLVEINGEWVELRPIDVRAAQEFFSSRKEQLNLSLEDALRISTGDTQVIQKLPVVDFEASGALQELIMNLTDNRSIKPIETPQTFQGELRPYQALGAGWLAFLERWGLGACLADDMGLGKTIELLAFLLYLQEEKSLEKPVLLVCPTSVVGNWEREVKKFAPTLSTLVHHGDKRAKGKNLAKAVKGKDLVITSYALVFRDSKDLKTVAWQGLVLDEAQNVKNSEAKQSQAVRELEAEFKIALTGTPVENRLQELWSIMDFLNPGYLGTRQFFQRRFATPIEKFGDTDSLKTLRSLVQPFILRRLKTDRKIIQDLPEKQEMAIFCGLSAEQAKLYEMVVESALAQIEEAEGIQRHGQVLALLTKLKQICNHPAHFLKESKLTNPQLSGKLLRLEEMLEEVISEGDRTLIFTQFAEWGKLLKAYLEKQFNQDIFFLYGGTRKQQREEMIDTFQNDPQAPKIFILSLKAGGVGLNLTRANHVFHYDRWWNPAVENQATDRVFRIGQTRNVQVHKFVCTGTLEEKIHDLIESKQQLAEQIVGTGEDWLSNLDTNQLRNLLLLDRSAIINEEES